MATVGDVTVRLNAELGSFTAGMQQAQAQTSRIGAAIDHLSQPTFGATRGLREMEFGMRAMALQAAGTTGPIGSMAAGLAQLTLGGSLMLGVLAAFAAVGIAMQRLEARTREETEALEQQRRTVQAHLDTLQHLEPSLEKLEKLQQRLKAVQAVFAARYPGPVLDAEALGQEYHDMLQGITALQAAIVTMEGELSGPMAEAVRDVAARMSEWSDQNARVLEQIPFFNAMNDPLQRVSSTLKDATEVARHFHAALKDVKDLTEGDQPSRALAALAPANQKAAMERFALDQEQAGRKLQEQMARLGVDAIGALIRGMIEGTKDLAGLLKAAILQLVEESIVRVIEKALAIASPSRVAYGWGANIVAGMVGGLAAGQIALSGATQRLGAASQQAMAPPGITMNVTVPAPVDPFSWARDAQWQRGLRESLLVASAAGFRAA